ncbi:TraB/GumN family protein [Novosphingobium umbonatum]|uniref:TraB/GumN family protein n=1 Tax=Novosphingobium umbonatum TaxID=1908524 RepID=A0A437N8N2_9SPHN|nr:TraB/GumN family protein [Novosphingobium umbonatum]RVU06212.1 TraB/GumN family protein [Novosphingobium umbonatum]
MRKSWLAGLGLLSGLGALALWLYTSPAPVHPALWQVEGPQGQKGWLFGTIHALPRAVDWRRGPVEQAWQQADSVVVEIAALNDSSATAKAFESLAHTPALPPLDQRLPETMHPALAKALSGRSPTEFTDTESWAAALMLARDAASGDPAHGIDRAILSAPQGKTVVELEGAMGQLSLFDRLPESAQRRLLAEAINAAPDDGSTLAKAWSEGNVDALAQETKRGMLADPVLRQALFVGRNQAWAAKIEAMLRAGKHPFVAVGAAHMAGEQGLPAMLAAQGYKVKRVQ